MYPRMKTTRQQSGVVLVMTLVILLIVTLLGTSSIQMTGLLEKMSRNASDSASAMGAAEAALRAGEAIVEAELNDDSYDNVIRGKFNIPDGTAATLAPRWKDKTLDIWNPAKNLAVFVSTYSGSDPADPNTQPRYFIERVKAVLSDEDRLNLDNVGGGTGADRTYIFRITALGTGKTSASRVFLQGTYGKKF
jgi:type IV pilus assembly protein PilX